MSTVKVGDVIEHGEAIPDNVTRMDYRSPFSPFQRSLCLVSEIGNGGVTYWINGVGDQWSDEDIPDYAYPLTVTAVRDPAPDAPQVYSIPEQPEGVTRVSTAARDGSRTLTWQFSPQNPHDSMPWWSDDIHEWASWYELFSYGTITVLPEPRVPRTFPKLDGAPEDVLTLSGASGRTYARAYFAEGVPVYAVIDENGDERHYSFYALAAVDGPLTEVFEDEVAK